MKTIEVLQKRKTFIIITVIILLIVTAGIFTISYILRKNTPAVAEKSDFKLEIAYDRERNTVIAHLYNLSGNDYDIKVGNSAESFADIFISCDTGEIPVYKHLILAKVSFPKNSSLKQEMSLDGLELSGKCEVYAQTVFYIMNPDTSETEEFKFVSNKLTFDAEE